LLVKKINILIKYNLIFKIYNTNFHFYLILLIDNKKKKKKNKIKYICSIQKKKIKKESRAVININNYTNSKRFLIEL